MLVDHVGWVFFPDDLMWRSVGRICVPIWLFLAGYAAVAPRFDRLVFGGFIFVAAVDIATSAFMPRLPLPLNILGVILLARLCIGPVMRFVNGDITRLFIVTVLLAALAPLTSQFVEYGTAAFLFVMTGHMTRHGFAQRHVALVFAAATWAIFVWLQTLWFPGFTFFENALMGAGTALSFAWAARYAGRAGPYFTHAPHAIQATIQFVGRHSLGLYVTHVALLRVIALVLTRV